MTARDITSPSNRLERCSWILTASPLTVSVGGKVCALTRVGGEDGTKYRAALPYGSDVTIHVADASFLLVTDKKSNYLNDAGVNPTADRQNSYSGRRACSVSRTVSASRGVYSSSPSGHSRIIDTLRRL